MAEQPAATVPVRIDKWLWFARVVKSRTLAKKLVQAGKVRLNGTKTTSASAALGYGDVLTVTLPRRILVYRVLAPGSRRGPAVEAQSLFEDLSPPVVRKNSAERPAKQALRDEGAGRPTKRERRQLSRFRAGAGEEY